MKGMTMGQFSAIALGFVVVAIVIAMGGDILQSLMEGQCADQWNATSYSCDTSSLASNITLQGLEGQETFGDWLPTIAVVIAAAVVIGVIVTYFRFQ